GIPTQRAAIENKRPARVIGNDAVILEPEDPGLPRAEETVQVVGRRSPPASGFLGDFLDGFQCGHRIVLSVRVHAARTCSRLRQEQRSKAPMAPPLWRPTLASRPQ